MKNLRQNQQKLILDQGHAAANTQPNPVLSGELFTLEPIVNLLEDPLPQVQLAGLNQVKSTLYPPFLKKLREMETNGEESVLQHVRKRLQQKELYFRRKFFYFQDRIQKYPGEMMPKLGFSIICLRYAQYWVKNPVLQKYFLEQALKYLNQLIRVYKPEPRFFYFRGQTLLALGYTRLAKTDFEKVLESMPQHTGNLFRLLDIYLAEGDLIKITDLVKKLKYRPLPKKYAKAIKFWLE